ncbi:uncharacterized protein LOC135923992 [Gordionus sp. m RMFG-2023]|uniref:uncharacterized protein LOC135923992 n=1 Tax=Gordionus sp. m RMFG-2023 TaxID=3053472 RepID=UPI0031FDC7C7
MESGTDIFFDSLEKEIKGIRQEEKLIIGVNFNAHIGKDRLGYEKNHGGYEHGLKNKEGERFLQVSQAYDMEIVNTYFQKRKDHIVTYRSEKHFSQIYYLLIRRKDLWRIKDCKVISVEEIARQHPPLVMDLERKFRKEERFMNLALGMKC